MRLSAPGSPHLTYCTNIHPGERWAEVRETLRRHVLAVRDRVAADRPFGLGLRLSAAAARELSGPGELAWLRDFLDAHGLYLFTINGFPYGPFHGAPVKERVYLPDWTDPERLAYTNELARILAALLPDESVGGTISTVPGGFAPRVGSASAAARMAAQIGRHAAVLHRIREETGREIALALEPEPCCHLETVSDAAGFFRDHLFGRAGTDGLSRETGLPESECGEILRRHLGVCFDTCHMAVEWEEPEAALRTLEEAGVRTPKFQISAGLEVEFTGEPVEDREIADALRAFAEGVYLHQVVERRRDGALRRFLDLPEALESVPGSAGERRRWRVHFHVPLFLERFGRLRSTQAYVDEVLGLLRKRPRGTHWEVETYTWDVLPEEHRREDLVEAIARELRWVRDRVEA